MLSAILLFAALAVAQQPANPGAPPDAPPVDVAVEQTPHISFLQLLMKGGWFMVPIGLCSLVGMAIIIERAMALRRRVVIPPQFLEGLRSVMPDSFEAHKGAMDYCHRNDCPIARVLAVGIRKMPQGEEVVEQAIEDAGANEVAKLRRNLRMLFGASSVAPMLGLLGTVWGMITAFQVASAQGLGRAELLAEGIYEALVTTFAGLTVAIPLLIFYYYFLGKIERLVSEMNDVSEQFIQQIVSPSPKASPSSKPSPIGARPATA